MHAKKIRRTVGAGLASLVLAGLAACGSGDPESSSSQVSGADRQKGVAAAETAIADYLDGPTAFPVDQPLSEVPAGADIAYVDCGAPYCALIYTLLEGAAKAMGVNLQRFKAGYNAAGVSAALDSVVASKPDAVIVAAVNIELWKKQAEQLQGDGAVIVTTGVTGVEKYGIESPQAAEEYSDLAGRLMADYITAEMSDTSDVVIYSVPEISYTGAMAGSLTAELGKVCPACKVRTVEIPAATLGNSAPATMVRDLQANPSTTVAAFPANESNVGLTAALSAAGIEIDTIGNAPTPTELQAIKDGDQTVGLGFDTAVFAWSLLDQAARAMAGQDLSGPQAQGVPVLQFLGQKDITFDPALGWTGYPDFADRFTRLWTKN